MANLLTVDAGLQWTLTGMFCNGRRRKTCPAAAKSQDFQHGPRKPHRRPQLRGRLPAAVAACPAPAGCRSPTARAAAAATAPARCVFGRGQAGHCSDASMCPASVTASGPLQVQCSSVPYCTEAAAVAALQGHQHADTSAHAQRYREQSRASQRRYRQRQKVSLQLTALLDV